MPKVNASWFKDSLLRIGMSGRQLADKLGMPQSSFSLFLHGKRKLKLSEVNEMARLLGVPAEEILINSGVPLNQSSVGTSTKNMVRIGGWVDKELNILWEAPQGPKEVVNCLVGASAKTSGVLRGQLEGPFSKALLFFRIPGTINASAKNFHNSIANAIASHGVVGDCISRPSIVGMGRGKDEAGLVWKFGVVERGYSHGKYNILSLAGKMLQEDAIVSCAVAVEIIKI